MGDFMHHRRSIRLQGYDYTQNGAYFVTICTHQRRCIFGDITDSVMRVNRWGEIVQEEWARTAIVRANVELDAFVVMPNHVHGIIVIVDPPSDGATRRAVGATRRVARTDEEMWADGATRRDVGATRRVARTDEEMWADGATRRDVGATRRVARTDEEMWADGPTRRAVGATRRVARTDEEMWADGAIRRDVGATRRVARTDEGIVPGAIRRDVGAIRRDVGATRRVARTDEGIVPGATRRVARTDGVARTTLPAQSLGSIIGQFKSIVTKRIMESSPAPDHPIWQRSFYEHIIRSEAALNAIRAYVIQNPSHWSADSLYTG